MEEKKMAENTSGMATTTLVYGNVEIVVYRPILTEEERKKREAVVHRALVQFGKEMLKARKEG
jgi:hypothetical protein